MRDSMTFGYMMRRSLLALYLEFGLQKLPDIESGCQFDTFFAGKVKRIYKMFAFLKKL